MSEVLIEKTGHVTGTSDYTDNFEVELGVGSKYYYKVKNPGGVGGSAPFNFWIRQIINVRDGEEYYEEIIYHVREGVKSGETKEGEFTVRDDSKNWIESGGRFPEDKANVEFKIISPPVGRAHYTFKVWVPSATVSD